MEPTGNLKKQVEKAETKNEKKSLIENAGMLLNDDELDQVAGGQDAQTMYAYKCERCNVTYAAIIAGTECPKCYLTDMIIDLTQLASEE